MSKTHYIWPWGPSSRSFCFNCMYGYCGVAYFIWYDNKTYMLQFRLSVHEIYRNQMKRYSCHVSSFVLFSVKSICTIKWCFQCFGSFSFISFPDIVFQLYTHDFQILLTAWKVSIKVSIWAPSTTILVTFFVFPVSLNSILLH